MPKFTKHQLKDAVDQNIKAVHEARVQADSRRRLDEKIIDNIVNFLGNTSSQYIHVLFYGLIFVYFGRLQEVSNLASIEAIFLGLFVLANQRRMSRTERKHSDLHLQTSLLIENELTKLARVIDTMAKALNINESQLQELHAVKQDIDPTEVINLIKDHENNSPTDSTLKS